MEKYSCVIVDDEPLAQELLTRYVGRLSNLELVGTYDNAVEALAAFSIVKPDVIFLDIQMPEMTGIELLQSFGSHRPAVILVTAYPEYALDGFEYDVIDYLLKPVEFSRFHRAVQKLIARIQPAVPSSSVEEFFMVKSDKKLIKVFLKDIMYISGMSDYAKIHTISGLVITHMTMKKMEKILTLPHFMRINRSYIVQLSYVKTVDGNMVELLNEEKIPIGIRYRDEVKKRFKGWTI